MMTLRSSITAWLRQTVAPACLELCEVGPAFPSLPKWRRGGIGFVCGLGGGARAAKEIDVHPEVLDKPPEMKEY